jgi:hypothetical protein
VVAGMVLDVAKAAPLPEAKPNEILATGFGPARRFLARETAAKRVCGAVVAIAHDDKLVPRCLFALASMTKPMAAIAGLMLLEQDHNRRLANCLSPPFVIFMKRQAFLARFRSARIRGFKSRTSNHRDRHSLLVAV